MMEVTTAHIISGLIGGLIRAIVGITKDQTFTPENLFGDPAERFMLRELLADTYPRIISVLGYDMT